MAKSFPLEAQHFGAFFFLKIMDCALLNCCVPQLKVALKRETHDLKIVWHITVLSPKA